MSRPVDLNIGNSIIQAFAQGRAEALERLRNKQVQDQLAIENEREIQKQKIDQEQFDAQLKQRQLEFEARQKLDELGYQLNKAGVKFNLEEGIRKTIQEGGIPSGYQKETLAPALNEQVRQMPAILGQPAFEEELLRFKRQAEDPLGLLPETITERNPLAVQRAATVAKQQEEIRKFQLEQQAAEATQRRTQENKLFESQIFGVEAKAKLDQDLTLRREEMAKDLEIARLNAAAKEASGTPVDGLTQAVIANPRLLFDETAMTPTIRAKVIGNLSTLGFNPLAQTQEIMQKTASSVLDMISDIEQDKKFTVGGAANIKYQVPGAAYLFPEEYASAKKVERLVNTLAIPELASITLYPVSENDREFLKSIATYMHYGLQKENFDSELKRLKGLMEKIQKTPIQVNPMPRTGATPNRPNPADFDRSK